MNSKGALAIFVKTPELSPVKTRLAADLGAKNALEFYNRALKATAALAKQLKTQIPNLQIFWAVAEEEGIHSNRWQDFKTVYQGEGGLGDRLNTIYNKLINEYDYVGFMGADSPHIPFDEIQNALNLTKNNRSNHFVLGETFDGGFYFFGGSMPLPKEAWLRVEYSTNQTALQLESQLIKLASVLKVNKHFDIDTLEDFKSLAHIKKNLLPEQIQLIEWALSII